MNTSPKLPKYTIPEEIANGISHGVAIVLAIAGLAVLTASAALRGSALHVTACAIYGASLILCFTTSTVYHSVQVPHVKEVLRALDHSSIFILIAGTYTPFMLVNLNGPWGWTLLVIIWTLAIVGIALRLFLRGRLHGLVVGLYIAMGWAIVVAIRPMLIHVGVGGLILLAAGGLAYTTGVIFYKWTRLPFHHAIWHGFVILGSAFHFFAVLFYVIPRTVPT